MRIQNYAAMPSLLAIAIATQAMPASSADRTIDASTSATTTQTLTGAGDTLTVLNGGSVATTDGHAISLEGINQILNNKGSLSTTAMSDYAVQVDTGATSAQLLNSGDITTYGDCSYGVYSQAADFTLINDGTITTHAHQNSWAIFVDANRAKITNNATIRTHGDRADAVEVYGSQAKITNNGTIEVSGNNSIGIYTYHNFAEQSGTTITNSGTIRSTGTKDDAKYGQAIFANATGATVINSGTLYSKNAEAIRMGRAEQTLRLLQGSQIEGSVIFNMPETATIEIEKGLQTKLTMEGRPNTIETYGQPYAIFGSETEGEYVLAVFSQEVANGATIAATSSSQVVGQTIGGRIGQGRQALSDISAAPAPLTYAFAPTASGPTFPNFAPSDKFGAWTSAFGAYSAPTGNHAGSKTVQGGALFGFDTRLSGDRLAGLFGGYGEGTIKGDNGSDLKTKTFVAGGYGSFGFGAAFVDVSASLGITSNDISRRIMNNKTASGFDTVTADFNGFFFSPSVTLGYDYELETAWLTPKLSLIYSGVRQGSYNESGSGLAFGSQVTHLVTARGEIELGTLKAADMRNGWRGSVTLGAEGTYVGGGDRALTLAGNTQTLSGTTTSEARGFIGADIGYAKNGYHLTAKTELGYSTENIFSANGQLGFGVRF